MVDSTEVIEAQESNIASVHIVIAAAVIVVLPKYITKAETAYVVVIDWSYNPINDGLMYALIMFSLRLVDFKIFFWDYYRSVFVKWFIKVTHASPSFNKNNNT